MKLLHNLYHDEQGVAAAEYALLLSLIAVASIASVTTMGDEITRVYNDAAERFRDLPRQ